MKLHRIVSLIFFSILVVLAFLAFRLGAFLPVEMSIQNKTNFWIVYKKHQGAYHKIVPILEEVEKQVRLNNENCQYSFGQFFDNPKEIEAERLRAHVGCLIQNPELFKDLPQGYYLESFKGGDFLRAYFKGSPAIGPYKVYTKAMEELKERGLKKWPFVMEIYEITSEQKVHTEYLFPLF